jgi:hypothetical protein
MIIFLNFWQTIINDSVESFVFTIRYSKKYIFTDNYKKDIEEVFFWI